MAVFYKGRSFVYHSMVITFVMDQYSEMNNGTTMTAVRFAEKLREKGHEVRVITASDIQEDGVYVLPEKHIPVFQSIVDKQGMRLAQPVDEVIARAIEGSDVVHMLMPFWVQHAAARIAEEKRVATTAAFHIQPENITYSIHMSKWPGINSFVYSFLRRKLYDKFSHIHCPSEMMKNLLIKNKYRGEIHAISNGVCEAFEKRDVARCEQYKDKFVIMMIGRYSREKRQDLIIKAIGKSKYNDRIQLVLAGKGPTAKKLKKLSDRYLKNPVDFVFLPQEELIDRINMCDLYVHASDAESEAISCIEAFTCGLVPVISDSKICATKQFALDERNLFRKGNYKSLREKIEWFIEHPREKAALSEQYEAYAKQFTLDACVDRLADVFVTAVQENKERWQNTDNEQAYLQTLSAKQKRAYEKGKKKYCKQCDKQGKHDYKNAYITTVKNGCLA